MVFYN